MENTSQTILVVDDTSSNIDILVELLDGYDVLVALDGETAIELAIEEDIDLILLDIVMPELDGYQTCLKLKEIESSKDVPIIFITGKNDEDSIEKAYDFGGIDYVTKPFKPKELLARVKAQLKIRCLIEHLEHLSSFDVMTGIFNRRKFFEQAQEGFDKKPNKSCAMMLDIDKFKDINDSYGHPFGDRVIQKVAEIMSTNVPDGAILGRLGGEEFAIVSYNLSWEDNCSLVETIRKLIAKATVKHESGKKIQFTVSAGLAMYKPALNSLDALLKQADDALYQAKEAGRNQSIFT
ncbi:GGDEF domain-containing response regulator [Thalassotalea atypica]|uniref:GGDEF domain-containing response regulator n=1 Tax=Thalassotalea atypica TaxID=2054316 RepID=UPI002573D6D4|nr:diguanylate cyclase [Thalassotalea atypica]